MPPTASPVAGSRVAGEAQPWGILRLTTGALSSGANRSLRASVVAAQTAGKRSGVVLFAAESGLDVEEVGACSMTSASFVAGKATATRQSISTSGLERWFGRPGRPGSAAVPSERYLTGGVSAQPGGRTRRRARLEPRASAAGRALYRWAGVVPIAAVSVVGEA